MSEIPPEPPFQQQPGFSNYPRAIFSPDPYRRPPGVYMDSIGLAWRLMGSNLGIWVLSVFLGGLMIGGLSFVLSLGTNYLIYGTFLGQSDFKFSTFAANLGLGLIQGMFINIFVGSFYYMGLKQARNEPIALRDMFSGFSCAIPLMISSVLTTLAFYAGFLLLIVPSIFLIGALAFVPLLIIDKKLSATEAIVVSFKTLRSHAWAMFGLIFVGCLILLLGYCAIGIGLLFAVPVYLIAIGLTYNNFFPKADPSAFHQPIGTEPPR